MELTDEVQGRWNAAELAWLQNFGARLRLLRECCGASQRELAAAAGVSRSTLSRYENGRAFPKPPQLVRLICALYGDLDFVRPGFAAPKAEDLASMRLLFRLNQITPPEAETTIRLIDGVLEEVGRRAMNMAKMLPPV